MGVHKGETLEDLGVSILRKTAVSQDYYGTVVRTLLFGRTLEIGTAKEPLQRLLMIV